MISAEPSLLGLKLIHFSKRAPRVWGVVMVSTCMVEQMDGNKLTADSET